jgi:Transposase, Mutator family
MIEGNMGAGSPDMVLKRKTGAGALRRPVLVALGLRFDGKKDVIDLRLATTESAAQWEQFLGALVRRAVTLIRSPCGQRCALPTTEESGQNFSFGGSSRR